MNVFATESNSLALVNELVRIVTMSHTAKPSKRSAGTVNCNGNVGEFNDTAWVVTTSSFRTVSTNADIRDSVTDVSEPGQWSKVNVRLSPCGRGKE